MKQHEAYCAQLLDLGAAAAKAMSERLAGEYQLALLELSAFLRAGAHAMAYRQKSVADLCDELRAPRQFVEPDTEADKPSSKRRKSEE